MVCFYFQIYVPLILTVITDQTVTKQQTHVWEPHSNRAEDNNISTSKFSTTLTHTHTLRKEASVRTAVKRVYPGEPGQLARAQVLHPPVFRLLQRCVSSKRSPALFTHSLTPLHSPDLLSDYRGSWTYLSLIDEAAVYCWGEIHESVCVTVCTTAPHM